MTHGLLPIVASRRVVSNFPAQLIFLLSISRTIPVARADSHCQFPDGPLARTKPMPRTRSHAAAPEVLPDGIRAMSSKPGKYECMTCPNRLTSMPLHQALPHGQCSQHIRYFASFRRAIALRDTKERADAEKSPAAVVPCQDSLDFGETGADDPDLGSGTSDVRYDNDLGEENLPPSYSPPLPMTRRGMRLAQRNASFRIVSADRGTGITMGTGKTTTQQLLDDISAVRDSGAAATSDGDYAPFPDKVVSGRPSDPNTCSYASSCAMRQALLTEVQPCSHGRHSCLRQ